MAVDVRPARADELGPVAAALRAAGLGANVGRLLEFPSVSPAFGGRVHAYFLL